MRGSGILRGLARAPIPLYDAGLGFLFGHRLLLLEHRGRRTGVPRRTMLEVVDRPAPNRYVVPAGFGERSQWLRNVRARPQVRVSVGRQSLLDAEARVLTAAEATMVLSGYPRRHPLSWALLRPVLRRINPDLAGGPAELAARIPLVELTLAS